jgi:hypothetical protein
MRMRALDLVRLIWSRRVACVSLGDGIQCLWQDVLIDFPDHEAQDAALFTSWKIDALKCKQLAQRIHVPMLFGTCANVH